MKLILTSDLHCDEGIFLNILLEYLDFMDDYAKEHGIKKIFILGDLLNKANNVKSGMFIELFKRFKELKENGYKIYLLLGNHDIFSILGNRSLLETFEEYCTVISTTTQIEIDGIKINLVPYTKEQCDVPTYDADYLFTHLDIATFDLGNGKISNNTEMFSFKPELFAEYKKVFTGHYHRRQKKENIEYIGSPYQLSFGEAGDENKGFVVFDTETETQEFIRYPNAPKFFEIDYETLKEKLDNEVVDEKVKKLLKNSFLKIKIDKKIEGFSKFKVKLYDDYGVIDIVPNFIAKSGIEESSSVDLGLNESVYNMLNNFIANGKFTFADKKIKNENLLSLLKEIENEI